MWALLRNSNEIWEKNITFWGEKKITNLEYFVFDLKNGIYSEAFLRLWNSEIKKVYINGHGMRLKADNVYSMWKNYDN